MEHTPYGYEIREGRAVVNEEQAGKIIEMCENYLSGMSLINAASSIGFTMSHCGVKRMMFNKRYLGDDFYPAILSEEMVNRLDVERKRREKALGRDNRGVKDIPKGTVYSKFCIPRIPMRYQDPVEQAEFAYSLIRNEVSK